MVAKPIQSPSYPSLALKDAIEAVKKIEQQYRSSPADRIDAARLLGYSGATGPSNMALAALAAYGLVERAGKGMLRVTPLARAILHPQSDEERVSSLKIAATSPRLYQEIRDHFPDLDVPPMNGVVTYLNRRQFNPSAVPTAAKAFLATATWVKELAVSESNGHGNGSEAESELSNRSFGGAAVGDLIQWESQGVLQFETPRRVRWVSPDGTHVAVDGSDTGIAMNQVTVESAPAAKTPPPQSPPPAAPAVEHVAEVNKINFKSDGGGQISISATLDAKGLDLLKDKIEAFKLLLN